MSSLTAAIIVGIAWVLSTIFALSLAKCAKISDEECRQYYERMKDGKREE